MLKFILNNQTIETDLPIGTTVLDFVRYHKNLKGTKIGCREGDCGACTILVGELQNGDSVKYRTMTSCLMPIGNAQGKHIVTVEGINKENGELTAVQQAMVDESGTQCGFCTVGFVMSLTNFCIDETPKTCESAISAIDGNICRCTGYKSIERACASLSRQLAVSSKQFESVPNYFDGIKERLSAIEKNCLPLTANRRLVAGGTDLYVQKHEEMVYAEATHILFDDELRTITETDEFVELGASVVVTDLLESDIFNRLFPNLYKHLKLVSSTPIRNMATLGGNFTNASPIGDMTAWFLALDAEIIFNNGRVLPLKDYYLGYKTLAKSDEEFIKIIRFKKDFTHFNFEKVCKRTYLDIASVNTAISLKVADNVIEHANVSIGGVFATPLYLRKTSEFLSGKEINEVTINEANEILQTEISPISDVRGTAEYKRLLAGQLFKAHFVELFEVFAT
jgi:xanthine dehydrogenase small subunit